jgi:hypothetical protein
MMTNRTLSATLRLCDDKPIPADWHYSSRLDVNLTSDARLRTAWPCEMIVLGDEPLRHGEERTVELRIEARPFSDYVSSWRPRLFVCRNDEIVGYLNFPNAPLARARSAQNETDTRTAV